MMIKKQMFDVRLKRLLALLIICCAAQSAWAVDRPNIVVFLVDDLGWQDLSAPLHSERTAFNDFYQTPNVEQLAAQGVSFTQAYACAVCSPTRTSIMTGQNAARHQVTNWTLYPDRDTSGQTDRLVAPTNWRKEGLQSADATLAKRLKQAGYFTIHVGKAHWGAIGTSGADPLHLGFDVNIAGHSAGGPGHYHGQALFGNNQSNSPWGVPGLTQYHGLPIHLTDALTVEALRAVDRAIDENQPFYLYLAHYAVHAPIQEHAPYAQAYRDKGVNETEARYASMVQGYDASLGAVMAHLNHRGQADRTLIVFVSDNGGLSAHGRGETPMGTGLNTHNAPLRAGKGSVYEGGVRVPQIVAWAKPNSDSELQRAVPVSAGVRCDAPTIIEDLFPTVLRWAGAAVGDDDAIDGRDWTALLTDKAEAHKEVQARVGRPLLFHYPHVWSAGFIKQKQGYEPHSSLRLGDWKVIYFYHGRQWELYNLANDLGEQHNLAQSNPDQLRLLAERLITELDQRSAQYPVDRHTSEADRPTPPGQ